MNSSSPPLPSADPAAGTDPAPGTDPAAGTDRTASTDPTSGIDRAGGTDRTASTDPTPGIDRLPTPERRGAFQRVRDRLGADIVNGTLAPHTVFTIEELERRTGTSRSIVREATRVLVSLGMLRATQRIGLRVLPDTNWNVFDPHVIRWRLASSGRRQQLRELFELRLAVEPEAARLAAERRDDEHAAALLAIAHDLAGADAHPRVFLRADLEFHRLVLRASGNSTFVHLGDVIGEALRERATVERADRAPEGHDLRLHSEVAASIDRRDGASASAGMREIIERTHVG